MNRILNFFVVFITTAFLLLEVNGFNGIKGLEKGVDIRVFLNETASPDSIPVETQNIESLLKEEKGIEKIIFISKEEALDEFRKSVKNSESFIDDIEENPLPSSFKIVLKPGYRNPAYLQSLEKKVMTWSGVSDFIYSREYLKNIWTIIKYFEWLSFGLCILLCLLLILAIITSLSQELLKSKNELALLSEFGVSRLKLTLKMSLRIFLENIGFVGAGIGLNYLIYRFLWVGESTCSHLYQNAPVFFSIKIMLVLVGSIGILALFISFIFSAITSLREPRGEV